MNGKEFCARFPALALWQTEVRAGLHGQDARRPSTWRTGTALYRAACLEAVTLDLYGQGCDTTPDRLRREVAEILERDANERSADS